MFLISCEVTFMGAILRPRVSSGSYGTMSMGILQERNSPPMLIGSCLGQRQCQCQLEVNRRVWVEHSSQPRPITGLWGTNQHGNRSISVMMFGYTSI